MCNKVLNEAFFICVDVIIACSLISAGLKCNPVPLRSCFKVKPSIFRSFSYCSFRALLPLPKSPSPVRPTLRRTLQSGPLLLRLSGPSGPQSGRGLAHPAPNRIRWRPVGPEVGNDPTRPEVQTAKYCPTQDAIKLTNRGAGNAAMSPRS